MLPVHLLSDVALARWLLAHNVVFGCALVCLGEDVSIQVTYSTKFEQTRYRVLSAGSYAG